MISSAYQPPSLIVATQPGTGTAPGSSSGEIPATAARRPSANPPLSWGHLTKRKKSYAKRHPKGRWWLTTALSPGNILHCPVEAYPSLTSGTVRCGVSIGL